MKSLIIVLWSLFLILGSMGSAFGYSFTDSFEGTTLDTFWTVELPHSNAEYSISGEQHYDGSQSLKLNSTGSGQRYIILGHQFDQVMQGTVSVRFYDPTNIHLYSHFELNKGSSGFGIGVQDWDYTYYHAGGSLWPGLPEEGQTALLRSQGWHKFEAIFDSSGTRLLIDGNVLRSSSENIGFNHLQLNLSGPGGNGAFYFDQFSADVHPIPLPPTILLMGSGLLGLVGLRRFRKV